MTAEAYPHAGTNVDLPDPARFARGVAHVLRARMKYFADVEDSHAVFVLQPVPPGQVAEGATRHYALDDGETMMARGLWFVGPNVMSAARVDVTVDFDEIFPYVSSLGLGPVPAVIFRPTADGPRLKFYPNGLANPDDCQTMHVETSPVTLERVLDLVDVVHQTTLVTPLGHAGGPKLWKKPTKYHVAPQVEVEIQAYVRVGLSVGLPGCEVNIEQNHISGRLDIEIEQPIPGSPGHSEFPVILELKVLRDFGSTGIPTSETQTIQWVSEGVTQAFSYRIDRGALAAALCCFDMRAAPEDQTCFAKAERKSKKLGVVVRSWPIFPTAKAFREWRAAGVLAT